MHYTYIPLLYIHTVTYIHYMLNALYIYIDALYIDIINKYKKTFL